MDVMLTFHDHHLLVLRPWSFHIAQATCLIATVLGSTMDATAAHVLGGAKEECRSKAAPITQCLAQCSKLVEETFCDHTGMASAPKFRKTDGDALRETKWTPGMLWPFQISSNVMAIGAVLELNWKL